MGYFNVWIVPILGFWAIGKGLMPFLSVLILIFIFHPVLDFLISRWGSRRLFQIEENKSSMWLARIPLYSAFPLQLLLLLGAFHFGTATVLSTILAGTLCGISGGIMCMCAAHELIHREDPSERMLGKALLHLVVYPHFQVEHFWHHQKLATVEDISSARKGESLYTFLIRSISSGWKVCWKWKPSKMAELCAVQVLLVTSVFVFFGSLSALLLIVHGMVSIILLKWVDYLEHYGLVRGKVNGKYESIQTKHSWDSTRVFTNWYLYNLGFHSEHHKHPGVHYDQLPGMTTDWHEHPYGYSTMMLMALFPRLWRNTLDPILEAERNLEAKVS